MTSGGLGTQWVTRSGFLVIFHDFGAPFWSPWGILGLPFGALGGPFFRKKRRKGVQGAPWNTSSTNVENKVTSSEKVGQNGMPKTWFGLRRRSRIAYRPFSEIS